MVIGGNGSQSGAAALALLGTFVPVALADAGAHAAGEAQALRMARLLAAVAGETPPFVVLADDSGSDPARTLHAGRIAPEQMLPADAWPVFARGCERIAGAVLDDRPAPSAAKMGGSRSRWDWQRGSPMRRAARCTWIAPLAKQSTARTLTCR